MPVGSLVAAAKPVATAGRPARKIVTSLADIIYSTLLCTVHTYETKFLRKEGHVLLYVDEVTPLLVAANGERKTRRYSHQLIHMYCMYNTSTKKSQSQVGAKSNQGVYVHTIS